MTQTYRCDRSLVPFDHAQALSRLETLFHAQAELTPMPLAELRHALFDAARTSSQLERTLMALARHPAPGADLLLDHPALNFTCPRRSFALTLARKLRARRRGRTNPTTDAANNTRRAA